MKRVTIWQARYRAGAMHDMKYMLLVKYVSPGRGGGGAAELYNNNQ